MHIKTWPKIFQFTYQAAAVVLLGLIMLFSAGQAAAQTVLQGYSSDQVLQRGMLVTQKGDDQTKVEAITDETIDQLKGVVADANDSPVTLSGEGRKVFVATTGTYEVLVSNENGAIKPGDYISVSSLEGIGAKATETQSTIVGRAVSGFEGGGDSIGRSKASNGQTVEFGRIKVDLDIGRNPLLKTPDKDRVPDALQKAANSIAEKEVQTLRIYLALVVLLVTAAVAGTTLFSGVRSTIISIGRNPLSKGIILKGLIQVLLLSLIIFLSGLFGVYLLIKL